MRTVVCVKQVPDTTEIRIDPKTNTLIRDGVPSILNPYDQFAVEEAVKLRDEAGEGQVTVLSMGPPQARSAIMKCLALGADDAILLSDRAFAGADTWATSYTLAAAIRKVGDVGLVLCGQQAIDGDTAQVGPEVAQQLGIPQVTYVEKTELTGKKFTVHRQMEDGYHVLEVKAPVMLAVVPPTDFQPGVPPMSRILKAKKKPFDTWTLEELGGDPSGFGLDGSPTQVVRTYSPPPRGECMMLECGEVDAPKALAEALTKHEPLNKR